MRVRQVRLNTHLGYGALPGPHYEARVIDVPDGTTPADCKIVLADTPLSDWGQYRPVGDTESPYPFTASPAPSNAAPPAPVVHDAPPAPAEAEVPATVTVPAPEPEANH